MPIPGGECTRHPLFCRTGRTNDPPLLENWKTTSGMEKQQPVFVQAGMTVQPMSVLHPSALDTEVTEGHQALSTFTVRVKKAILYYSISSTCIDYWKWSLRQMWQGCKTRLYQPCKILEGHIDWLPAFSFPISFLFVPQHYTHSQPRDQKTWAVILYTLSWDLASLSIMVLTSE